ncbi:DNA polymerase, partial [Ancylostoma caninum]
LWIDLIADPTQKKGLDSYFAPAAHVRGKVKDDTEVKLDDDEDLKDMLAGINDEALEMDFASQPSPAQTSSSTRNPFKREASPTIAPRKVKVMKLATPTARSVPPIRHAQAVPQNSVKAEVQVDDDDDYGAPDFDDYYEPPPPAAPLSSKAAKSPKKVVKSAPNVEVKGEVKKEVEEMEVEQTSIVDDTKPVPKPTPQVMLSAADWDDSQETTDEPAVEVVAGSEAFYVKEDGQQMIRMYWLDAFEDPVKHSGTVYLFGRVNVSGNKWASCCVTVKNIFRQVFFLPRDTKFVRGTSTNEQVKDADVFEEVKVMMKRHCGTASFKCRQAKKRFMHDGTISGEHSSDEVKVIEVQYESNHPKLPTDLSGETFSAVFNTTTTAMERLLVEKAMMGPGWIDVTNYTEVTAKQSYCDYEFTVDMERMRNLNYNLAITQAPPPVRMLVLNVLTTLNDKKENEICMISTLYNPVCNLSNPSTDQKDLHRLCMFTKPYGGTLPFDIKDQLTRRGLSDIVLTAGNEKALLSLFLAKVHKYEPDIIVGHDLSASISVLVSRMDKLKVANWSRTSRLKRTINVGKVAHNKAGQWELTAGRMLVDSRLSAMELVRSRSYDLSELVAQLLGVHRENIYANEVGAKFSSSQQLLNLIQWSWMDPWFSLRVIAQINALPLAVQITNIVGGVTSRTLMGGRAERNEYLLLHAFNKANYVAPNKYQPSFKKGKHEKEVKNEDGENADDNEADGKSKNKAQYSGGLVLEPKKGNCWAGLYDTLILLLDFNSLYPSIIQEYNICFTTVAHTKDGDDLPDIPSSSLAEGILPCEIRGLVERRRQVKRLMKEAPESKKKQYDIRQMALKLTANSMYGCLGFQQSRFYAKPLAALITSKGREILMHTKDLVEKLGYSVVYGDTDSIMINTNSTDLKQAKKLGFEIKRQVNQCHRLLELELDGVFKRMLLLKKKKYAALTVNPDNELDTKKELKGLDIVRRDWSQLAKEAGNAVVDLILDPKLSRDELVAEIHESLQKLRARLDKGMDTSLFEISKIKRQVNQCHRLLELELDGVFKRMLLLKKKKYAALTVNPDNELDTKKELKGLDIVRRDWSQLAKEAGNAVVDLILDPKLSRDELVAEIHESLQELRARLDKGMDTSLFEISKQLTRNPKDYHDLKSQPHAAVAMRLNETGKFSLRHGDIVEYIICEDGTTNSAMQRAYHRTELESNPELKIDLHYYLAQQVHPVVSRLCAPIEETDAVRIAEALGMDSTSYRRSAAAHASDAAAAEDEWAWQGPITYDHCEALTFICPSTGCGNELKIRKAVEEQGSTFKLSLEACDKCGAELSPYSAYICNRFEDSLKEFVARHLSSYFKCDDAVCEFRTKTHLMKWCREGLECPKCPGGVLRKEYSAKDLFDQQMFLKQVVDVHAALQELKQEQQRSIQTKPGFASTVALYNNLSAIVARYLDMNAYSKVDLAFIFAPMMKIA